MALLEATGVVKRFGGVVAVDGFSLEVEPGQVVALIGPNGAGKSTFMDVLSGLHEADAGEIRLGNRPIQALNPAQIARRGVGRTFQVPRVFRRLTVVDNVLVPVSHRGEISGGIRERAQELLELVDLSDKAGQYARELSGGQQKLLELARALMAEPQLVLMDEPFAGVHPELKQTLIEAVRAANRERGTTFLVVSHEMPVVAALCGWVFAMHLGGNYLDGPPDQVLNDERLVDIYLGQQEPAHADQG
ncbi:MAG: ABC transporter ATP-binding protein [Actinomycetota bacterium]|nr:ABC transporter ATP-binding protein [Actinomycetota bacterium]